MRFYLAVKICKSIGFFLGLLSTLVLLSACGQKGALYLPDEPSELAYLSSFQKTSVGNSFLIGRKR